jgi:hypothetical protein
MPGRDSNPRSSVPLAQTITTKPRRQQGCQMVCFQTKNTNLGKFCRALHWKMFIYFMATWNILWRSDIFYDHLIHFLFIWYNFSSFGIKYQEKSGNHGRQGSLPRLCD